MERLVFGMVTWAVFKVTSAVFVAVATVWRVVATRVTGFLSARRPVVDPHLERLSWWRSATGIVLVIAANLVWNPDPERLMGAWNDAINGAVLVPVQIAVAVVVSAAMLVALMRRGQRRQMLVAALVPIKTVFACVMACALLGAAAWGWVQLIPLTYALGEWQMVTVPVMLIANLLLMLVIAATVVHGARAIVRDRFRARDAHPAMGAFVIAALSVWALAIGVIEVFGRGFGDTPFPLWVSVCLLVVGPVVNLGLSVYEVVRLQRQFGVALRSATWSPR